MKKKITAIVIILVLTSFSSYWVGYSLGNEREEFYKELDLFAEGLSVIEKKHVEDKTAQDLIYGAMEGLLSSLDSYSQFLTPEDYKDLLVETEGQFGGLGIEITIKERFLTIVTPIEDTPAWRAGLEAGDIIVKIDGELTKGITLNEAVKKLRGEPETNVDLVLLKDKTKSLEEVTVTRGIIKIKDIKRAMILEDGIGYLRIAEFRETTTNDLDKALRKLKAEGLKGLIIDVRNNPGGLLYSAIEVTSRFLENGKTVVSTKTREQKEKVYKTSPIKEKYLDIPIVILINKGSASGSEILAAALRENKRGILLGETTFGKGSVQTILPLSDGSALRLTTSKYYTPNGTSIHEKGIDPDVEVELKIIEEKEIEKKEKDVFEKVENQESGEEPKKEFDYKKDYQITRAVDLIKGLVVLGSNR
ncbi:MAG: S41 family peptidase [Candidatus Omnitrophica bacterium]|nr:S41 family peptidase [Candidatus Omnitrophota bacterium]